MRVRYSLLAAALSLTLLGAAAPVRAAAPLGAPSAPETRPFPGFKAEGLALSLRDGQLSLAARELWLDPVTRLVDVTVRAPLETGAAFFEAPVTSLLGAFARDAEITVGAFEARGSSLYSMADLKLQMKQGKFLMTGRKITTLQVAGDVAFDAAARSLSIRIARIKAGFVPVPRSVAFGVMSRILKAPFLHLENPVLRIELAPFLR